MSVHSNSMLANGHGGAADCDPGRAAVRRHSSLPGGTARDLFFELGETEDPRFVFPLLQAEMRGLTVRRLNCQSQLKEPPPADPWFIIIDDQWIGVLPKDYHKKTTRWLFEAADCIAMTTAELHLGFYHEFIEAALKAQRILLIHTFHERLVRWLDEITAGTKDLNSCVPMKVWVKGAQRSTRPS